MFLGPPPQTCVCPDVCLGIAHVSGKVPLPGQGVWQIHNVSAPFAEQRGFPFTVHVSRTGRIVKPLWRLPPSEAKTLQMRANISSFLGWKALFRCHFSFFFCFSCLGVVAHRGFTIALDVKYTHEGYIFSKTPTPPTTNNKVPKPLNLRASPKVNLISPK